MSYFQRDYRDDSLRARRIWAAYEMAYTIVDFAAAACFVVGSVMFFFEPWKIAGTWCFLAGSILFAVKPSLRLAREIRLAALGDTKNLAERLQG